MSKQRPPRVIVANVYFAPFSYGGATVVAENMAKELAQKFGWEVLIVTSFYDSRIVPYTTKRYTIGGLQAIAICVPYGALSFEQTYANPQFDRVFVDIVDSFDPDVVHVHCVQNLGASFFRDLASGGIPFAVTVHDAWWICERQFMISSHGLYCHQERIDMNICRHCVPDIQRTAIRQRHLHELLSLADACLFPSRFFRELGVANGFVAEKCLVNKNGIVLPSDSYRRDRRSDEPPRLRFGFVGGPGPNKGAKQILDAFRGMKRSDYELVIVDAAQNAGRSWRDGFDWRVPGKLRFHPAYTTDTMDSFFEQIDVLLFPSQWKESFGLTVREALARDVWVIATDAGGVAEDCIDGVNSTIIPMTPDHRPLERAIEAVLDNSCIRNFENPAKASIRGIEEQARELSDILGRLVRERNIDRQAH